MKKKKYTFSYYLLDIYIKKSKKQKFLENYYIYMKYVIL